MSDSSPRTAPGGRIEFSRLAAQLRERFLFGKWPNRDDGVGHRRPPTEVLSTLRTTPTQSYLDIEQPDLGEWLCASALRLRLGRGAADPVDDPR
jgi:hypothetical protein